MPIGPGSPALRRSAMADVQWADLKGDAPLVWVSMEIPRDSFLGPRLSCGAFVQVRAYGAVGLADGLLDRD
jgi:hypothetical protein